MEDEEKKIVRQFLTTLDDDVFKEISELDKNRILSDKFYSTLAEYSEPSQVCYLCSIFANNVKETSDSNKLKELILERMKK